MASARSIPRAARCLILFAPVLPVVAVTIHQSKVRARASYQIERAEMPSASPPWAILGSVPRVAAADADLSLALPAGGGHYMVAELQPFVGGDKAILLRFSSEVGEWVSKYSGYPLPARILCPNRVVSHSGRLWWVDLSWCLLTCDPFEETPVLRVVPLPEGKALKSREAWGLLDKYRCVRVSGGKLRFVDMYSRNRDSRGATQISVLAVDPSGLLLLHANRLEQPAGALSSDFHF